VRSRQAPRCKTDVTLRRDAREVCIERTGTIATSHPEEATVGRFLLGFIVAIVLVLFIVARCVGAIV
jgi:hypothetical protein